MKARPIFYDTETTGVKEEDYIIELAAFDPDQNKVFEKLIKPPIPIPKEATLIHHISDEMVENAPFFGEIIGEFIEFCSGDVILVAHNNDGFDKGFLEKEFLRNGAKLPSWRYVDTLKWARKYRRDLPRHALQFLREIYGITANTAHRALDDVLVLHQIYKAMTDDLHIDEVYTLLNAPKKLKTMPFGKHQGLPLSQVPSSYVKWLEKSGAFEKQENQELKKNFQNLGLITTGV